MEKKKKIDGQNLSDLVENWVKLDDPRRIEEAVREWTKKRPFKEPIEVPA